MEDVNKNLKLLRSPVDIFLSITHKCNLKCFHCSVYPTNHLKELSTQELLTLINQMSRIKVFTVRISGGEPFLREDILLIIEYLIKNKIRISINTNAMFITDKIASKLSFLKNRIDDIMVSIDGSNKEIHDALRGDGSFEACIEGVKQLIKAKLPVSAYTTVVKYNVDNIENIIKLCHKLGLHHVKFNELLPIGMGLKNYRELCIPAPRRKEIATTLIKLRKKYKNFISGTYLQICDIFRSSSQHSNNYLTGCGATLLGLTILPDGSVTPCDRLQDFVLGNIKNESILKIWRSSKKIKVFRRRFFKTLNDIEECRGCNYKQKCTGGCPAVPYYLEGNLIGRDILSCCRIFNGEESHPLFATTPETPALSHSRDSFGTTTGELPPIATYGTYGVRAKNLFYF